MINSENSINSNSNSKSIENEMSSYTMNVSAFERVMEREFASYLKHMNQLGLLSVSLKECRSALATGIPVEKKAKKSGRPKKLVRSVNESDIIADLTAKAEPKRKKLSAEEKAQKKAEAKLAKAKAKEEEKAKKALLKAKLAEEKKEKKRLEKEKKALEKSKAKAEKLALKKAEQAKKKLEREKAKAAKKALKNKKAAEAKAKLAEKKLQAKKAEADLKKANQTELVEESYQSIDIVNTEGEVIGNKVENFVVPPSAEEVAKQKKLAAAGLKPFKHESLPDDELYIDNENCVWRCNSSNNCDHIGNWDQETNTILSVSDSEDESDIDELSDTE